MEISFGVQVMRRSVRENEIGDGARPVLAPSLYKKKFQLQNFLAMKFTARMLYYY